MGRLLLVFALFILLVTSAMAENANKIDNLCFVESSSDNIGWAELCSTDDDWTAGWYVYQKGCDWTYENRAHLRGSLNNKGDQSCKYQDDTIGTTGTTDKSTEESDLERLRRECKRDCWEFDIYS